jgi:hypothetical protein
MNYLTQAYVQCVLTTPRPLRVIGVSAAWRRDRVRPVQGNLDPLVLLASAANWLQQSELRDREVRVDDREAQGLL